MASALMARQTRPPQGGLPQPHLQPWTHLIPSALLCGEGTRFPASRTYLLVAPWRGERCEIRCRQPQGGSRWLRMLQLVEAGPGAHLRSAVAKGQCVQGQKTVSIWAVGPVGISPRKPHGMSSGLCQGCISSPAVVCGGDGDQEDCGEGRNALLEVQEERAGHGRGQPEGILFYHPTQGCPHPMGPAAGLLLGEGNPPGRAGAAAGELGFVPPGKARQGDTERVANTKHNLCPQCHHGG